MSGSGISWTACKSAPCSRQITMPAPHHSVFIGRLPFPPPNQQCQSTEDNWNCKENENFYASYIHTHPCNGTFPGLPRWASTRKVKPIWILLKQDTMSGSGISWAICKSAPRSRQITTPVPHHSVFTGRMPFLPPNQQRQSTEGTIQVNSHKSQQVSAVAHKPR